MRRLKTLRRPPIYPKSPGHLPCSSLTHPLPLPSRRPSVSFGGFGLNLMEDSRTTNRWFFVVVMGRRAGHLALAIGKSAGATFTLIPEEFPGPTASLDEVCNVIEGAILKRQTMGRKHGLDVIAEGISEKLDPQELTNIPDVEVDCDEYGHLRLGEIPLATILRREIQRRFAERQNGISVVDVTLGYELRCASPIPFDIDYTRTLGYGAARFLLSESDGELLRYGGMVCLESGHLRVLPFEEFRDPETGRTRVRLVDIHSEHYNVAREYMIRLSDEDLEDRATRNKLAKAAGITYAEFKRRFASAVRPVENQVSRRRRG